MAFRSNLWTGNYQPLRIIAHMAGALSILPHEGLPFDGLLEWAAFMAGYPPVLQYHDGDKRFLPRVTDKDPANFVIPIKRIGHKTDPDWHWSASWTTFPKGCEMDRTHWNRRFDAGKNGLRDHVNFMGATEKVSVSSGRYKGYHMPMALVVTPEIHWFCVGASDGIAKLLGWITHLGKKRSQGNGEVVRWEIWTEKEDWSCWRDGQPMRAIPDQPGDFRRAHIGIRPPHWHQSRQRLCIVPNHDFTSVAAQTDQDFSSRV